MRLIRIILAVIIVLGLAGAGVWYYLTQYRSAETLSDSAPAKEIIADPLFLPLDSFTVTLNDQRGPHILYIEITLQLQNRESLDLLRLYMPEVRNRILAELAKHEPAPIQTPEGRVHLADAFGRVLSAPYHVGLPPPEIDRVLFTAFVVQ